MSTFRDKWWKAYLPLFPKHPKKYFELSSKEKPKLWIQSFEPIRCILEFRIWPTVRCTTEKYAVWAKILRIFKKLANRTSSYIVIYGMDGWYTTRVTILWGTGHSISSPLKGRSNGKKHPLENTQEQGKKIKFILLKVICLDFVCNILWTCGDKNHRLI